ncbi:type II toxin-antitoxin system RelE/ParE family toxin [Aerosakkonema funiforme]|uniref:type II toxin-antitoxin system RelE/ParE family toxin n=1 Tax=Aerosakkonema funiforme TaxID=1246630 RepID=UPI0035B87BCC
MPNNLPLIEVKPTLEFKSDLRALSKKYRHIKSDIQPVIERLQTGELLGDRIPGIGYEVFKARVRNSDIKKGKSGGYRLIYYIQNPTSIILISIYSKSEQSDIAAEKIRRIVTEFNELSLGGDFSQDREETQDEKNGDRPSD